MEAAPEALPALGGCDVPQASAVVQAAAGHKVPQVVEGHPPDRLGVVCVGGHTALLLKAPQLDTRVTRSRRQMAALQQTCMTVKLHSLTLESPEADAM